MAKLLEDVFNNRVRDPNKEEKPQNRKKCIITDCKNFVKKLRYEMCLEHFKQQDLARRQAKNKLEKCTHTKCTNRIYKSGAIFCYNCENRYRRANKLPSIKQEARNEVIKSKFAAEENRLIIRRQKKMQSEAE